MIKKATSKEFDKVRKHILSLETEMHEFDANLKSAAQAALLLLLHKKLDEIIDYLNEQVKEKENDSEDR